MLSNELDTFSKKGGKPFRRPFTNDSIAEFDWESFTNECLEMALTLVNVISETMSYMDSKVKGRINAKRLL